MSKSLVIRGLFIAFLVGLLSACSTQKARWSNIAYHNTTTHYNVWWNGNESLKEGVELLEKNAKDDYTAILPVYKLGNKEEAMTVFPQMDRAIEKGVKGIKKHSMNIRGKEYVPYIPECYLLTAYAAFYKQDYSTSANTCRIMHIQYAGSRAADEAAILLGRSLTAQQQYIEAESTLDQLVVDLGKGNFNKKLETKLYLAMAEATLPQQKYKKSVQFLKMALDQHPDRATRARINFIIGQVYQKLDNKYKAVATRYFEQCLKNGPDYVMEFNARINIASCADLRHTDIDKLERELDKMLKDKKNEEYHDQIYYAKGEMFMGVHKMDKAMENFRRSVAVSSNNPAQKAKSALRAAEIYYDVMEDYDAAQRYYDTAMVIIPKTYPGYADIKVRYDLLTELTNNTRRVVANDSLLRLANMPASERQAFIQKIIDEKKRREEEAKKQELMAQYAADAKAQQNTLSGDWYFYNSSNVQKGKESFTQRWGVRVLEDYWFLSKKNMMSMGSIIAGMEPEAPSDSTDAAMDSIVSDSVASNAGANDPNSIAFYEKGLPTSQQSQDSMRLTTAEALLNAGYLYYDGIRNTEKALQCYLRLANELPDYEQIVQAFYMLYRIYNRQGNTPSANYYRDMVLMGFPDSDFANLIRDENYYKEIAKREKLLQDEYDELYTTFRRRRYKEVVNQAQVIASEYPDDYMVPRFRYWEAMSYTRLGDDERAIATYNDILKSVASSDSIVPLVKQQLSMLQKGMPQTEPAAVPTDELITDADEAAAKDKDSVGKNEAKKDDAEEEKPLSTEAQMFRYRENMQHYVAIVVDEKKIRATEMQYKIADFNSQYYSNSGYRVNPLMFSDTTQLITIHRFSNAQEAVDYATHLLLDNGPLKSYNPNDYAIFPISTQNYTTFYSRKNVDAYREFYDRYYIKK